MREKEKFNRRTALKTISGAVATSPMIGSALGSKEGRSGDEKYRRALDILDKSGNHRAFVNHLQNNGFSVATKRQVFDVYKDQQTDDDVSTQQLYAGTMTADLTLTEYCWEPDATWALFDWSFDLNEKIQSGEKPNDVVGIYFPTDDYDRDTGSQYGGDYVKVPGEDDPTVGDLDPNGVAFEWDDYAHHEYLSGDGSDQWPDLGSYVGLKLLKQDPSEDPATRLVTIDYEHTYRLYPTGGDLASVSISAAGLSISLGPNGRSWDASWDESEKNLEYKGDC